MSTEGLQRKEARNVLLHGTPETPEIVKVDRRLRSEEVLQVTDITSLPPVPGFFGGRRRPYAIFAGRQPFPVDIPPSVNDSSATMVTRERPSIATTSFGIITVSSQDQQVLDDLLRRPYQRVGQFGRMTGMADELERKMDQAFSSQEKADLGMQINRLRNLALNMYADELSNESFTKNSALSLIESRLPTARDVERIIRKIDIHIDDIYVEVEHILRSAAKESAMGRKGTGKQKEETEEEKRASFVADEAKKEELEKGVLERTNEVEAYLEVCNPGYEIKYSAILDRPNPMVARYFRQLFDRPF